MIPIPRASAALRSSWPHPSGCPFVATRHHMNSLDESQLPSLDLAHQRFEERLLEIVGTRHSFVGM